MDHKVSDSPSSHHVLDDLLTYQLRQHNLTWLAVEKSNYGLQSAQMHKVPLLSWHIHHKVKQSIPFKIYPNRNSFPSSSPSLCSSQVPDKISLHLSVSSCWSYSLTPQFPDFGGSSGPFRLWFLRSQAPMARFFSNSYISNPVLYHKVREHCFF